MGQLSIYPSEIIIQRQIDSFPPYMRANSAPHAVIWEGALNDSVCDELVEVCMSYEPHKFPGCEALTRDCPMPLDSVFSSIWLFATEMNGIWWKFNLDHYPGAYMQTYNAGEGYLLHTDTTIGISRKLTAVVMLTDPQDYTGGRLELLPVPNSYSIPKTRGTIVVFPSWILHKVHPVVMGTRQTINMGFWGPPFK
jgi:hypothetical protein